MGAPIGNNNAVKAKPWREALDRALAQDDGQRLRNAAEKLLDAASNGEEWAIKEIADRLDGRPHQTLSGPGDRDLIPPVIRWEHVKPADPGA